MIFRRTLTIPQLKQKLNQSFTNTIFKNYHNKSQSTTQDEIQLKKQLYEQKYSNKLQQILNQKGLKNIEEFKLLKKEEFEIERKKEKKLYEELLSRVQTNKSKTNEKPRINHSNRNYKSPIRPLNDILDLSKVTNQTPDTIKKLWVAYHLKPSKLPRLGATIPLEIYNNMINNAKKYPSFVVPIPTFNNPPESKSTESNKIPMEMHFLQWSFINPTPEDTLPDSLNPITTTCKNNPPATTVLFTPLAEYQLRQEFSQPSLILTHYTELSNSHQIVLMRGDITPSTLDGISSGRISLSDAQLLILRLQQIFYWNDNHDLNNNIKNLQQSRQNLLKCFHENPNKFNINELLESFNEL
ncbi:hypothetical protein CROQUDRAFT_135657 [Cronartium quercuum f. sp. fusiforme G11]|uniref:ATP synthase mitochondrial F1 complex assembly factor 1 n=1 Tax=Cronartium quercuum f. sp. fusiforme G11 TaxID=708437 RepID=A0A9P6NER3_9BASI|nr:hypothetical protein CROQUDRAFT_135657 [Cronartium quercuum f. sp. fusiforme G11]